MSVTIPPEFQAFFDAFPTNTKMETRYEVVYRFIDNLGAFQESQNTDPGVGDEMRPVVYWIDCDSKRTTGPFTIEQIKALALKKRESFPTLIGRDSDAIHEFDKIKLDPTIKTVIVLDYVQDDILMWYIIATSKLFKGINLI